MICAALKRVKIRIIVELAFQCIVFEKKRVSVICIDYVNRGKNLNYGKSCLANDLTFQTNFFGAIRKGVVHRFRKCICSSPTSQIISLISNGSHRDRWMK